MSNGDIQQRNFISPLAAREPETEQNVPMSLSSYGFLNVIVVQTLTFCLELTSSAGAMKLLSKKVND